jgi:hypothetical protein
LKAALALRFARYALLGAFDSEGDSCDGCGSDAKSMEHRAAIALAAAIITIPIAACSNSIVHGTALVVGVSPDGIALGQDHLRKAGNEILIRRDLPKFSHCGTATVCGNSGLAEHNFSCSFKDSTGAVRGGDFKYNSYGWLSTIEKESRVSGDAAPRVIADTIWKKARSEFDPIECFYFHTKEGQAQIESDGPVMYVVAGYPEGSEIPEVYAVRVQYDRQNKTLAYPAPEKIFPKNSENRSCLIVAGQQDRFNAVKENREPFVSIFRGFYAKRLTRIQLIAKDAPLSLQENIAKVAAFIDLESEFNENVGGGSSIAVISKSRSPFTYYFMPQLASK